jgi:MFS family permease
MPTLSPRASFATAAAVAGLALWASGAPSVVYPLYASQWGLAPSVTSLIFAIYPLALIPTLIVFGNLSDYIGRRSTILLGVAALALGSVAFGLAPDLTWVLIGRALMGVGVGLSLSPATAAMIEFGKPSRASYVTTASTATGLALATLVGGALVQYAPAPLHLLFWVLLAVEVVVFGLVYFLPRHTPDEARGTWRPRLPKIPSGEVTIFAAGTLAIAAAYSIGSVFLALGAQIGRDLVGSDNALTDGAIISISAVAIGLVAVVGRRIPPRLAVTVGPFFALVGLGAIILAGADHSLGLFIASSVLGGTGYSLLFAGGLGLVSSSAPAHHRGAVISAAYVFGYAFQAATALGLGAIATSANLQVALEIGSPVIVAIGVVALVLANARRRTARLAAA